MTMTIVEAPRGVTGGVDTHLDVHVAAALDPLGGVRRTERFETDAAGYKALLGWLGTFGDVTKVGVEDPVLWPGPGRYLRRVGVEVSRSTDRTVRSAVAVASPIPSTPSRPPGPP